MIISNRRLRAMYVGGRGNATARRFAHLWAFAFKRGLAPRRWVTLEVEGRKSGRLTSFPLGMADWNGHWYLVSMLGERCNWVKNVRAANGSAVLCHGRRRTCHLVEVPFSDRAPIIRRYLEKVPGARSHIPIERNAVEIDFEAIATSVPVFLVVFSVPESGCAAPESDGPV